jgi:hypothetical protein
MNFFVQNSYHCGWSHEPVEHLKPWTGNDTLSLLVPKQSAVIVRQWLPVLIYCMATCEKIIGKNKYSWQFEENCQEISSF